MDAFAAADSTSFSPFVGRVPKSRGHLKRSLPSGNANGCAADSRENEGERTISPSEISAGTGFGHVAPLDSALTCEDMGITTPADYDLREVLLGTDALAGYVSPSSEHSKATLTADELLPMVSSPELPGYPDSPFDKGPSHFESATNLEFSMTNYCVASMPSPTNKIGDFILTPGDLDLTSTTSCSTSDDLELSAFDSVIGYLDSDLGSLPDFANFPDYMINILGEPSAFYESLLFQEEQDPMEDSIDMTNCGSLLGIDVCMGVGTVGLAFMLIGFESC